VGVVVTALFISNIVWVFYNNNKNITFLNVTANITVSNHHNQDRTLEPEGSLPHLQVPATYPYTKPE
jgi:hypothetical protein